MLRAENISFTAGDKILLHSTTVDFERARFHVIMGANGAGKTTLLKLLAGDIDTASGQVLLEEKELHQYSKKELAKKRAVLSQHYHIAFPISVSEMVLMGRYPYFTNHPGAEDISICLQAMQRMNVEIFSDRDYATLSGGEAQKVQMSRVLSQIWKGGEGDRKLMFLDEPVSHLDVKYQHQLLQTARDFSRDSGVTVIAILHDINLAISFADRLLFMKEGRILHDIDDPQNIRGETIREVFDVDARILYDGQRPFVVF